LIGVSGPSSPIAVTEPTTITGNYKKQYQVTFSQTGVSSDFTGTVVTVDGTDYSYATLPASFWWDSGSSHAFSFVSPLIVNISRQYNWSSTSDLSTLQSDTLVIAWSGSVIGNYIACTLVLHDIGVLNVSLSKTVVGIGYSMKINVTVENQGALAETFNVTIYANTDILTTFIDISIPSGSSDTITFTWNTSGFAKGNYTTSVYVWPVSGETDLADNTFIADTVYVGIPGDVNGDGKVDVKDVYAVARAYGTSRDGPNPQGRTYSTSCDINDDDEIDTKDYYVVCKHYGEVDRELLCFVSMRGALACP
jgi:hypothetical protein